MNETEARKFIQEQVRTYLVSLMSKTMIVVGIANLIALFGVFKAVKDVAITTAEMEVRAQRENIETLVRRAEERSSDLDSVISQLDRRAGEHHLKLDLLSAREVDARSKTAELEQRVDLAIRSEGSLGNATVKILEAVDKYTNASQIVAAFASLDQRMVQFEVNTISNILGYTGPLTKTTEELAAKVANIPHIAGGTVKIPGGTKQDLRVQLNGFKRPPAVALASGWGDNSREAFATMRREPRKDTFDVRLVFGDGTYATGEGGWIQWIAVEQ